MNTWSTDSDTLDMDDKYDYHDRIITAFGGTSSHDQNIDKYRRLVGNNCTTSSIYNDSEIDPSEALRYLATPQTINNGNDNTQ